MNGTNRETQADRPGAGGVLFILLGASNLARAYSGFARLLEEGVRPRPARFLNAMGPGRGYSRPGGFVSVVYPPIGSCGLFSAAREQADGAERTVALVADIGNDIMYGASAEDVVAGLEAIFEKLRGLGADILAVPIPEIFEDNFGEFYFRCLRFLFYPRSSAGRAQAVAAIRRINRFLKDSESERDIRLIRGLDRYCGFDKIHYDYFQMHRVWSEISREIFRVLETDPPPALGPLSMAASLGANMLRLFFSDMLPFVKKGPEFY